MAPNIQHNFPKPHYPYDPKAGERLAKLLLPEEDLKTTFPNMAAEFVYIRSYSRWLDAESRREKWEETVERYIQFIKEERGNIIPPKVIKKAREAILAFTVMPSMRALWTAGPAAKRDNTVMYNCAFQVINSIEAFAECLYVLMCGTGYGFSVEKKYIDLLPEIPEFTSMGPEGEYVIEDSKEGWANSVKYLLRAMYRGRDLEMNYSLLRAKGAKLKTMGGRSSGPAPLVELHSFVRQTFQKAQGRKLTSLECHDILNKIGEIVVVGGVRRSSQISLSDLSDSEMASAKVGNYPRHRSMANNSAVYTSKPAAVDFLKEWSLLASSGTGERGIFNLDAARRAAPKRRNADLIVGTNPCAEIMLRSKGFCNLTEVVVRAGDDLDDLLEKVETATWLGAIQSTFTFFPYLSKEWIENAEEERLLGVSLTGQMDNPAVLTPDGLQAMKSRALKISRKASKILGINVAASVTCTKPSGTVSQLVNSASGVHARYSPFYIRRYRINGTDPLLALLVDQGIKASPENGQRRKDWNAAQKAHEEGLPFTDDCQIFKPEEKWSKDKVLTWVVSFPVKSPEYALTRNDISAIKQLEHYKKIQSNWCEHNASCTVYVKDDEWFAVGNWVYQNWDIVNGLSFLPFDGGKYEQAPYQEITEEKYIELMEAMPKIDYSQLSKFELEDQTEGAKELACVGDICEI